MNKLKQGLILLAIFILTAFSAMYYEHSYRLFVRKVFKFANGENIVFFGKDFHLFPSMKFVLSFGLFSIIVFYLISKFEKKKILFLTITIIAFFATTVISSTIDSKIKIIECTACQDGIRKLSSGGINYDIHFILSLIFSLLPLLFVVFKNRKAKIM
jgi:hypothetical protein